MSKNKKINNRVIIVHLSASDTLNLINMVDIERMRIDAIKEPDFNEKGDKIHALMYLNLLKNKLKGVKIE